MPLLVSRYTFVHHRVWVLPAVVVAALALARQRLGRRWLLPLRLAWTVYGLPGIEATGVDPARSPGGEPFIAAVAAVEESAPPLGLEQSIHRTPHRET